MKTTDNHKKGNILKVVELKLQQRVYDSMKQSRFSVEAMTREFNDEGIQITAQSIRKFIKNTKKAQRELIARDINVATEYKQLAMDYSKSLKDILTEVEEVKNEVRGEKDYASYNQLVGRLMQGIELIAKLTGDIKPKGSVDITLIYNEISSDIEKKTASMKKDLFKNVIDVDYEILQSDKELENNLRGEQ